MANQNDPYNKEIDFTHVSGKIKDIFSSINDYFFDAILFVKKYLVILIVLFVVGAGLGYYKDITYKPAFESKIFVIPNFRSADYLYSQVDLINSRLGEKSFFNEMGIKDNMLIKKIEIEPVVDIYEFIEEPNDPKFQILKLMADSGEISKILEDKITSKNYMYQAVTITTREPLTNEAALKPLLTYLNANPYLEVMKKEWVNNLNIKIRANDTLIKQIDDILNSFSRKSGGAGVFYSDDAPIHEIIKQKEKLIREQAKNRIDIVNYEKIIKDSSNVLNIKRYGFTAGKLKFLFPILLIILFSGIVVFWGYYKKQMNKRQVEASNNE